MKNKSKDFISYKEATKDMNFKERLEYIWSYYNIIIIAFIMIVLIILYILNITIFNPPPEHYFGASFIDTYVSDESSEKMMNALNENLLKDKNLNATCSVSAYFETDDPSYNMALYQKFSALLMIGEIDIIILPKKSFINFEEDYFLPLEEIFTLEELESFSKDLLYKEENISGIKLEDSKIIEENIFSNEDLYITIFAGSKNLEIAKEGFLTFLEK